LGVFVKIRRMDGIAAFDKYAEDYDRWFEKNGPLYRAEIEAIKRFVPDMGFGVEIGTGTGRFSVPFGIRIGVEPSKNMGRIAKARGISVCRAVGERLPFRDNQFDFALLVTVVCFVQDAARLLIEVRRILKRGGKAIVGFIDRESVLGQSYESRKDANKFYREARFYSVLDIAALIRQAGFSGLRFCQAIMRLPGSGATEYEVREGYGEGAFVAVSSEKTAKK